MDDGIIFDTHRFIKRLVETGMDERTAEVLAEEQVSLLNGNLATKFQLAEVDLRLSRQIAEIDLRISEVEARLTARISEVEAGLSARISEVEAGLTARISEVEAGVLKWMATLIGGLFIAQTGLVIAAIQFI